MDASAVRRVRDAAREVVESHHLPGIAIGVVEGRELVFCEGFGLADIERGEAMEPTRRQRIASITKTMVGLCVMALVDEGRISLDDHVARLLPDVRWYGPGASIRVRHLLMHTSGIGEAATPGALAETVNPDREAVRQPGDFGTMFPDGITVEAQPGSKWAYCNLGFALLGEIVVRAEGAPLHDVLQGRVFAPLGMGDTEALDEPHPTLTTGYHRAPTADARELLERAGIAVRDEATVDGHNIRGSYRPEFNRAMVAAGGVQSTVPDMARYAAALLGGGGGIVRRETFEEMVAPQHCPDARLESWGLAFARTPRFGTLSIGHGGAYFGGWNSNLSVFRDHGFAVIQHMNVMLDRPAPVFSRILRAVVGAPAPTAPAGVLDSGVAATAAGVYECLPGRLTNFRPSLRIGRAQIVARDGGLWLQARRGVWKQGVRLLPADPGDPFLFVVGSDDGEPDYVVLTRDRDGHVDGFRCDELVRMVRTEQVAGWV
ncbi:MAG TPA: serine hydrolase domain-containing protein [Dehalococcoidia bacterium]|nr:serine hydrolase domain-containing protein [Dehalococcoidia bacterium]